MFITFQKQAYMYKNKTNLETNFNPFQTISNQIQPL